jgi:hypothetical protein
MDTDKNIDIKNSKTIQKEGILVDLPDISNTDNKTCCVNMTCYNCNKCYIKEYKIKGNSFSNNTNNTNINKPLIDLYTILKKYNIDNISFN